MELQELFNTVLMNNCVHFISIGSAAHMTNKETGELADKYNHQFPPFLQKIKKEYGDMKIIIILIDPTLENPPHIVKNGNFNVDAKNNNFFHDNKLNISVYCFRFYVTYITEKIMDNPLYNTGINYIDITSFLNHYNNLCIKTNSLLFVHDFTGRRFDKLAYHFDNILGDKRHKIMYDICSRVDEGCYSDLTDMINTPIIRKTSTNNYSIFNPFAINSHELINLHNSLSETSFSDKAMKKQIKKFIEIKINNFKKYYISLFRRLLLIANSHDESYKYKISSNICNYDFEHIDIKHNLQLFELFKNDKINEILTILFDLIIKEIAVICKILFKKSNEKTDKIIDDFAKEQDPYKLNDIVTKEFNLSMFDNNL